VQARKRHDYVVYRVTPTKWVAMKIRSGATNKEIAKKIADYENYESGREWAKLIQPGAFKYAIQRDFRSIKAARDDATAKGDALLKYESPFKAKPPGGDAAP